MWWIDEQPYPGPPHYEKTFGEALHDLAQAWNVPFENLYSSLMTVNEAAKVAAEEQERIAARMASTVPPLRNIAPPKNNPWPRPKFAFDRRGRKTF